MAAVVSQSVLLCLSRNVAARGNPVVLSKTIMNVYIAVLVRRRRQCHNRNPVCTT